MSGQSASAAIASCVGFIVTELEKWNPLLGTPDWDQILRTAVQHANRHVRAHTAELGASTLSAVILPDLQPAFGIHVGDSKIYGLDRAFRCSQLSADQNVAAQLQALGVMNSPTSDTYSALERTLTQFVGAPGDLEPQVWRLEPGWEMLLLSTDGAAAVMKNLNFTVVGEYLRQPAGASAFVCETLAKCNRLGGADNATLVVVSVTDTDPRAQTSDDFGTLLAVYGDLSVEFSCPTLSGHSAVRSYTSTQANLAELKCFI